MDQSVGVLDPTARDRDEVSVQGGVAPSMTRPRGHLVAVARAVAEAEEPSSASLASSFYEALQFQVLPAGALWPVPAPGI